MNLTKISIAVLFFVSLMAANAAAATCTNASFKGVYGISASGLGGGLLPASSIDQLTADGNGNFAGTTTKSKDGTILIYTFTGTYQIAKNCTGTASYTNQDGELRNVNLIMNNGNKGAFFIQTDANHVESAVAVEQGTATCTDLGVKHTYSLEATGFFIGTGQIAAAGQLVLNGKGSLTGTVTFSVNGSISSLPVTGTYQINSNCTGTATFTPQGQSAINISLVIVNGGKELMFIETDSGTVVSGVLQE